MIDIALMPENHDGSPNVLGRTTSPELLEAIIKYQQERKPDMIIFCGDNIHGDHNTSTFKTAKQDLGMLPLEARRIGKVIRGDNSLTAPQKIALLDYLQFLNRVTQPVTSVSKQLLNFADCGALQLLEETVDRGGMGAIFSGNHYNSSSGQTHDEAHVLSLGLDRKYRRGGRVWVVDGVAERDGRGEIKLDQLGDKYKDHSLDHGTLYGAHSYGSGSDVLLGMMQTTEAMRLKSRAVIGGHVHQTGAGMANGIDYFITPGSQTVNKFVEVIGKVASFRGTMNVEYSRNPDLYGGYHKVTWASQKHLEDRFLKEETWAHEMIVEKYLPMVRGRGVGAA